MLSMYTYNLRPKFVLKELYIVTWNVLGLYDPLNKAIEFLMPLWFFETLKILLYFNS